MSSNLIISERPMTAEERQFLEGQLQRTPGPIQRWARGVHNAVLLWAVSAASLILLWLAFSWGLQKLMRVEIAKTSVIATWVAVLCAVFAVVSTVRWVGRWSNPRAPLEADLEGGTVVEERVRFTAARRFQEPEHGGIIYFLRVADDVAMVFFDHDSQDLGVQGEDPLKSPFEARSGLVMVRAPRSRCVVEKRFSGEVLDAGPPVALTLEPARWPDDEEFCDVPWEELDARLSSPRPG